MARDERLGGGLEPGHGRRDCRLWRGRWGSVARCTRSRPRSGLSRTERRRRFRVREGDASEARCTIAQPGGSSSQVRGDRQGVSETVGNVYATVGEFDGQGGPTRVTCRFDPPQDLLGTRTERPLMVHEANAPLRYATWGLFLGVFGFAGLGTLLILQGTVWRKPRA